MNKLKAKNLISDQKRKLQDKKLRNEAWITHTASLIHEIFGDGSEELKFITRFSFQVLSLNAIGPEENRKLLRDNYLKLTQFLDNCSEVIDAKGIIIRPKLNI